MSFALGSIVGAINWDVDDRVSDGDNEMDPPDDVPKKYVHVKLDLGEGLVLTDNRYYYQRHRLFTKFDEGIQMTPTAWFEVTPESVAT